MDLEISVLFRTTPGVDPRLDRDLHDLMAQLEDGRRIEDYKRAPIVTPWAEAAGRGSVAMFRDAGTFGMSIAIPPRQLADVRSWLAGHGITKYVLRIDEPADGELFVLLHRARCTACSGPLEYLDPRLHDIESPQLVCRPCGGLYELSAFSAGP